MTDKQTHSIVKPHTHRERGSYISRGGPADKKLCCLKYRSAAPVTDDLPPKREKVRNFGFLRKEKKREKNREEKEKRFGSIIFINLLPALIRKKSVNAFHVSQTRPQVQLARSRFNTSARKY